MKRILFICAMIYAYTCTGIAFAQERHALFTKALNAYVKNGSVNYPGLSKDPAFKEYIRWLAQVDPEKLPTREAKLAFWINAYNALTLSVICENYPLKSITQLHTAGAVIGVLIKATVWDKKIFVINNKKISLGDIEHKILRPVFNEPRVHFAIVCAAKGCPPLRAEAYEEDKLDSQLDEQARLFLSQKEKNSFDFEKKIAQISPIFGWFKEDFGKTPENILLFIGKFLDSKTNEALKRDLIGWKIQYTRYDWSLNE